MKQIIISIIVFLLLLQQVISVGLSPAEKTIPYKPGVQNDLTYYVVNNEHKDVNVTIDITGQLAGFVKITQNNIHILASEDLHPFTVSVNVPPTLSPGDNSVKVGIAEMSADTNSGVIAKIHVSSKLTINVPYANGTSVQSPVVQSLTPILDEPLKVISFQKYFLQDKINEFSINVQNTQNYTINPVMSVVNIQGIGSIKSPPYSLEPNQETSIISYWNTMNVSKGEYKAVISVSYENITINQTGNIFVVNETEYEQITGAPASQLIANPSPFSAEYIPYLFLIVGMLIVLLINYVWFFYIKPKQQN